MFPIKLLLVSGQPGTRIDFVAGWLGLLPDYMDNNWTIDPLTGQSNGNMRLTKSFSENLNIHSKLVDLNIELDPTSSITRVGAWHPCRIQGLEDYIGKGIDICHIIPSIENLPKIFWENRVKTIVSGNDVDHVIKHYTGIDPATINDSMRRDFFQQQLENNQVGIESEPLYPHINLEYTKLFVPNGSYYLCDKLRISADYSQHSKWNSMLALADSPAEITAWGQTWRQGDWPIYSYAMQPMPHS